jgi:hypothetical protein
MKSTSLPQVIMPFGFIIVLLMAFKPNQNNFDKISVREFELVDKDNKRRVSIKVEENGEVVFRMLDSKETIRVKLGAGEDGSGLVLLNDNTDPGVHMLSKKDGGKLTLLGKEGKKREY